MTKCNVVGNTFHILGVPGSIFEKGECSKLRILTVFSIPSNQMLAVYFTTGHVRSLTCVYLYQFLVHNNYPIRQGTEFGQVG
jgi:hypothetical protein